MGKIAIGVAIIAVAAVAVVVTGGAVSGRLASGDALGKVVKKETNKLGIKIGDTNVDDRLPGGSVFGKYTTVIDDKVIVVDKVELPESLAKTFTDSEYRRKVNGK